MGVVSPSSADWKSPKSPNDSNEESSSENEELKVKPSPGAAAESEKGPKPSYEIQVVRNCSEGANLFTLTSSCGLNGSSDMARAAALDGSKASYIYHELCNSESN